MAVIPDKTQIEIDDGNFEDIKVRGNRDAVKTLGVHQTLLGDDTVQFEKAYEKITSMCGGLKRSGLGEEATRIGILCHVLPKIMYGAETCTYSKEQVKKIQVQIDRVLLQAYKQEASFPCKLRYGRVEHGGLGGIDIGAYILGEKLSLLQHHTQEGDVVGRLMIASYHLTQMETGRINEPLFDTNYETLKGIINFEFRVRKSS